MKHLLFGINYIIDRQLLNKDIPLICGLTVTNRCNLKCRQCIIPQRGLKNISYAESRAAIDSFYRKGGRTLYLQGGEPFLWQDKRYRLNDIIHYSQTLGFYTTIIYTNGTIPIKTSADTVFISIDGLQKTHDFLRGKSFDRIIENISGSSHPSLYINYTINNFNKDEVAEFCKYMAALSQIQGIFFYFHTPYYGFDELYIAVKERREILHKLIKYKREYKILNSLAGLKSALKNNWRRPLDICQVYEQGKIFRCCRYPGSPDLCRNCGYLSYAEIDQTLKLKPTAIINALKYF